MENAMILQVILYLVFLRTDPADAHLHNQLIAWKCYSLMDILKSAKATINDRRPPFLLPDISMMPLVGLFLAMYCTMLRLAVLVRLLPGIIFIFALFLFAFGHPCISYMVLFTVSFIYKELESFIDIVMLIVVLKVCFDLKSNVFVVALLVYIVSFMDAKYTILINVLVSLTEGYKGNHLQILYHLSIILICVKHNISPEILNTDTRL